MENTLKQILRQHKLEAYQPFCERIINAYDGFPDMEPDEHPLYQLSQFLQGCDDEDPTELAIRFKHELAQLRVFELRAYKSDRTGTRVFFNPMEETYKQFSGNKDPAATLTHYVNIHPYPASDIIKKIIESTIS